MRREGCAAPTNGRNDAHATSRGTYSLTETQNESGISSKRNINGD